MWQADKTTCIHFSTWHSNLINSQISQDLNLKNVLFFLFCVSCSSPVIHGFKIYTSDLFVTLPELWDLSRQPLLKTSKTQQSPSIFWQKTSPLYRNISISMLLKLNCKMCAYAVLLYHCFCYFVSLIKVWPPDVLSFWQTVYLYICILLQDNLDTLLSHWQHVLWCCAHMVVTCQSKSSYA